MRRLAPGILSLVRCRCLGFGRSAGSDSLPRRSAKGLQAVGALKAARDGRAAFFIGEQRSPLTLDKVTLPRCAATGTADARPTTCIPCEKSAARAGPKRPEPPFRAALVNEPCHDVAVAARHLHLRA